MSKKKADVITFGNFKGGTGKSTTNSLMGYVIANMGYKVLICDFDPQGNVTNLFMQTKKRAEGKDAPDEIPKSLFKGISDNDIKSTVINIQENLDLIPNGLDFAEYPEYLIEEYYVLKTKEEMFESRRKSVAHFSNLLEDLKEDYDFIFIDTPPTMSVITDSAFYASDYILLILQTQEWSLAGAEKFVPYLKKTTETFNMDLSVIGVLPVIMKKDGLVDQAILDLSKDIFGEQNVFETPVMAMERIKRFHMVGLGNDDMHDNKVMQRYELISNEFLERLNEVKEFNKTNEV